MNDSKTVRIVPAPNSGTGPSKTQDTQVWCGDQRIKVQKLTLIAEPRNMWRAIIEAAVQVDGEIAAVVRDQDQATPAPVGSQCGDEPSKPRNWIGRMIDWVTGRGATRATTNTVTHMGGLPTLTVQRVMEITREMAEQDQRRAARMAAAHTPDDFQRLATQMLATLTQVRKMIEDHQRQAAHVAAGNSLTCTIDIERQAKEACDSLVEAFKAQQVSDELNRQIVQAASRKAEQTDERSRS